MKTLSRMLVAAFSQPRADAHAAARRRATTRAAALGLKIEKLGRGGGFNVWPPDRMEPQDDPFDGDHFAHDWDEVEQMVTGYLQKVRQLEAGKVPEA